VLFAELQQEARQKGSTYENSLTVKEDSRSHIVMQREGGDVIQANPSPWHGIGTLVGAS